MRDYSKVSPRFWTGDTGKDIRKLGPRCQVIAFYLLTCPSANMLGLYYLAMPTLCHETGSPLQGALKALRSLREANFAYYDVPSEQVYVPNMAREQIGERLTHKDNRHKAVLKELEHLRKTPFFDDFVERYRGAFELGDVQFEKPLRSPLGAPSKPGAGAGAGAGTEAETGTGRGESEPTDIRAARATRIPDDFELTAELIDYAKAHGVDPGPTLEAFKLYWSNKPKDATKLDWGKTWQSWVLREAKDTQQRNAPKLGRYDQIMQDRRNGR